MKAADHGLIECDGSGGNRGIGVAIGNDLQGVHYVGAPVKREVIKRGGFEWFWWEGLKEGAGEVDFSFVGRDHKTPANVGS